MDDPLSSDLAVECSETELVEAPRKRKQTSNEQKERVVGMFLGGSNNSDIAHVLSLNRSTVSRIVKNYQERGNTKRLEGTGRPHEWNWETA